ncbi:MAG TPA: hypothetical protein PLP66_13065 [Phycisphaerae bacterium]|nr:hypothetical protein [Phycisphaerae bacterium]
MAAAWLAQVGASGTGVGALGAWLVTVVALALAIIGRRRLAPGVSEGLFVAAICGLLLLNFVEFGRTAQAFFLLAASMVSLAVVWFVVAVWVERESGQNPEADAVCRRAIRRSLAVHAATVAGLLAAAVMILESATEGTLPPGLILLLALLLIVAGGLYARQRGALSRYAIMGVLLLLFWLATPPEITIGHRRALVLAVLLGGAACLIVVVAALLRDWQRRVRIWQTNPEQLTNPPPARRRLYSVVLAACAVVGAVALLVPDAVVTPIGLALAAYAALTIGHRWRSNAVGEFGLVLVGGMVLAVVQAWLPAAPANTLLGWALAGVYLLWLARFWEQQLNAGQPWTTTGRLVPAARRLGYAAVGGEVVFAALWYLTPATDGPGGWLCGVTMLLMLLHWSMLVRDAQIQSSATAALAAALALVAALVPVQQLLRGWGMEPAPAVLLAVAGLAFAVRATPRGASADARWPVNAYVGGLIPMGVAYALVCAAVQPVSTETVWIASAGVVLALAWRWWAWRDAGRVA